jgi:hypothetical protein
MIFEFRLTPIEEVRPWGEPPNQSLSWFALTLGEYRLEAGSEYLLNYSDEVVNYFNEKYPEYASNTTTLVNYQVVRLWEDTLVMIPSILEPVPKEIRHFLDSGYENYDALHNKANDWQESEIAKGVDQDNTWDVMDYATRWLNDRWLDSGYLSPSARIWIWSDENDVVMSWDNREVKVENLNVWTAAKGNYRINKTDFINEVREFDGNLMSQMNSRVETICRTWNNDEIRIDFEHLKFEQKDRATWLESKLNNIRKTDWKEVLSAIEIINL